jgi:antitoxin component of MazEF toxin-antitoxin module
MKVQQIKRKRSKQWYITLPSALAQALEFKKGEVVEWQIDTKGNLGLKRTRRRS